MTTITLPLGADQWRGVQRNRDLGVGVLSMVPKLADTFRTACSGKGTPATHAATITVEMTGTDARAALSALNAKPPEDPRDGGPLFAAGFDLTEAQQRERDLLEAEYDRDVEAHDRRIELAQDFLSASATHINGEPWTDPDASWIAETTTDFARRVTNMDETVAQEHRDDETRQQHALKLKAAAVKRALDEAALRDHNAALLQCDVDDLLNRVTAAKATAGDDIDWLLPDFVPARSIAFLAAPPFGHKSFTAMHMGLCIAAGLPWLGRPVKQGAVIYVAGEAADSIYRRLSAAKQDAGVEDAPFHIVPKAVRLTDNHAVDVFIAAAKSLSGGSQIQAVFLDTFSDMRTGVDENSAGPMSLVMDNVKRISAELCCAVIPLHHTNAAGDLRGSTTQAGTADAVLSINVSRGVLTITCVDAREFAKGAKAYADIEEVDLGNATSMVLRHRESPPPRITDKADGEAKPKAERAKVKLPEHDADWRVVLADLSKDAGGPVDGDAWFDAAVPAETKDRSVWRGRWRKAYARLEQAGRIARDGDDFIIGDNPEPCVRLVRQ